jgi:hypothetical protein
VPAAAARYIDSLLSDYDDCTVVLFKHVLLSGSLWTVQNREVPVPYTLIKRKLRVQVRNEAGGYRDVWPDVLGLVQAGLFDLPTESRDRVSRRFRVTDGVQAEYDRLTFEHLDGPYVDLFTGRRDRSYAKSEVHDVDGRAVPDFIRDAIRAIEPNGYANYARARALLDTERKEARRLRDVEAVTLATCGEGSPEHVEAHERAASAGARFRNDLHCIRAIRSNKTDTLSGGVIRYRVPYRVTSTGRVSFKGGGAQSASGEMIAALYEGVAEATGRALHNYDIVSSQPTILREKLAEASLSTDWLDEYLSRDKSEYASRAHLPVKSWKTVMIAVMMSATLPLIKTAEMSKGAVVKAVRKAVASSSFPAVYAAVREVLAPLYAVLSDWHTYLDTGWLDENGYTHGGKDYVRNAAGIRFAVSDYTGRGKPPHVRRGKLAAFVLQGQEAYFIHTLTLLGEKYGFTPIANAHDGLVTLGEIPAAAIQEAQEACQMPYVRIEEKPFG